MKKLLIVLLAIGSLSVMSAEVLLLETAVQGRAGNDYYTYPHHGDVLEVAKSQSIKSCHDIGGEVTKTKCKTSFVDGSEVFIWSKAAGCVTICRTE